MCAAAAATDHEHRRRLPRPTRPEWPHADFSARYPAAQFRSASFDAATIFRLVRSLGDRIDEGRDVGGAGLTLLAWLTRRAGRHVAETRLTQHQVRASAAGLLGFASLPRDACNNQQHGQQQQPWPTPPRREPRTGRAPSRPRDTARSARRRPSASTNTRPANASPIASARIDRLVLDLVGRAVLEVLGLGLQARHWR